MKITKAQLNSIIQEELSAVLGERQYTDTAVSLKPPAIRGQFDPILGPRYYDEGYGYYGETGQLEGEHYPHAGDWTVMPSIDTDSTPSAADDAPSIGAPESDPTKIAGRITQGPKKSFKNVHSTPGVSEALKQMVREELKNFLES